MQFCYKTNQQAEREECKHNLPVRGYKNKSLWSFPLSRVTDISNHSLTASCSNIHWGLIQCLGCSFKLVQFKQMRNSLVWSVGARAARQCFYIIMLNITTKTGTGYSSVIWNSLLSSHCAHSITVSELLSDLSFRRIWVICEFTSRSRFTSRAEFNVLHVEYCMELSLWLSCTIGQTNAMWLCDEEFPQWFLFFNYLQTAGRFPVRIPARPRFFCVEYAWPHGQRSDPKCSELLQVSVWTFSDISSRGSPDNCFLLIAHWNHQKLSWRLRRCLRLVWGQLSLQHLCCPLVWENNQSSGLSHVDMKSLVNEEKRHKCFTFCGWNS